MTIKSRIIVVASAAFLAASGLSLPALAAGTTTATTAPAIHKATKPKLPKALVGKVKAFKLGAGNTLSVEDRAGAWFMVDLAKPCKPLAKAKAIRIARTRRKDRIGSVVVGRHYCPIKSVAQKTAAVAPAKKTKKQG